MQIKIGVFKGDVRNVSKIVGDGTDNWLHTYSGARIKEPCSLTHPTIILNLGTFDPINCNYLKLYWGTSAIEDLARFYFIRNITYDGNLVILECEEDYLQTFKTYILQLRCTVIRQEFKYNPYIVDDRVLCEKRRNLKYQVFPNTHFSTTGTGNPVVLTVSGGNS